MPATSCKEAIKKWEEKQGISPAEATEVKLICQLPPIEKMDESLNQFENTERLSLSTNCIERMISLPKLKNLKILSLSRNNIKRIMALEEVGSTLEQLWLSYNQIEKLDGLGPCTKLRVFYISNNKVKSWDEVGKLAQLPDLYELLFLQNPIYMIDKANDNTASVLKRVPSAGNVDGKMVTSENKDKAEKGECI